MAFRLIFLLLFLQGSIQGSFERLTTKLRIFLEGGNQILRRRYSYVTYHLICGMQGKGWGRGGGEGR